MSESETRHDSETVNPAEPDFVPQPGRRFTLVHNVHDQASGETYIVGPAAYMREQGNALIDRILAGEDTIFNLTFDQSPDLSTAVLVRLQTDYAGWAGMRQVERWLER
jgi:hypothetical protein